MSRNSSGTYSLPAGNPVVSGTTIASGTHNTTLADVATELTNSLDRGGRGAMTAPLQAAVGSVSAPGVTFDGDTDSGLYRIGANNVGLAVSGIKALDVTTSGLGVTGVVTGSTGVTATTGNVTATAGSVVATAGDVQAASTKDFKYASAQTRYLHVGAEVFQSLTSGATLQFISSAFQLCWGSVTGSTHAQGACIRLPPGATITALEVFLQNVSGGALNVGIIAALRTYNAGTDTLTTITSGASISVANNANAYQSVPLGAGPYAIPDDGDGCIMVSSTLNQTAGGGNQLRLFGLRITYTVTKLRA